MNKRFLARIVAFISAFFGISILVAVLFPILSYEISGASQYATFLSPIPLDYEQKEVSDYTKASNWFEGIDDSDFSDYSVRYYNVSIPKLQIENAVVSVGGEDLSESLIQYPGTAAPGKKGNSVIFGHSVLPQFFDPENYLSIFSTLPTINPGAEIEVSYDGVAYLYRVEEKFEVSPSDIQILEQNRVGSYLTLVTCTPPGHPLRPRRLIVRAKLVPYGKTRADLRD